MFPKIIESKTDLKALGERMTQAKERYQSEYVAPPAKTPSAGKASKVAKSNS